MPFTISASNQHGAIKLERKSARDAFELAKSYRQRGYSGIHVVDTETGEQFSEVDIEGSKLTDGGPDSDLMVKPAPRRR